MTRRHFLASAPAALLAQETDAVIKVDVDIVNVLCSVRDKKGAFIKDLDKNAFQVFEEGKQQEIKYFTRETDLPLTIGMLIDVSGSQERLIESEKRAGAQFFKTVLRQKDMAFIISFGAEAELLQDLTNSQRLLSKGLDGLRLNAGTGGFHPSPTGAKPRGTIMYDAVYLAADEKLRREVGRKVIILITDGVDMGSRLSRSEALAQAQKADAIIYSVYYTDPRAYRGGFGFGGDGDLKKLSEETGGRVLRVDRGYSLDQVFQEISEEMRSQYAIGYTPSGGADGYRKLDVRATDKNLRVAARKGYFSNATK